MNKMKQKIILLALCGTLCFSILNAQTSSFEAPAKNWIKNNTRNLGISTFTEFKLSTIRKSNTGETLRFQQMMKGVPVFQSEIVVHFNKQGKLSYTGTEGLKNKLKEVDTVPSVSAEEAFKKAIVASKAEGDVNYQENKLFVYVTDEGDTKLVYRAVINPYENPGSWETIIDAKTGAVISVKDIAVYHRGHEDDCPDHKKDKKVKTKKKVNFKVTGSGYVFDPDPLSRTGSAYSGNFLDNNDATNTSFDNARTLVTLPDIEFANNVYKLKNAYVEIANISNPNSGLFTQATNQFLFNRSELGFEAVNVFWHVDKSMRYINETLGIICRPATNAGAVLYDPHALSGADNSSYITSGVLQFGQGGVDDGEDADVIIHELGHGIHHWLAGGPSNADGLSEGCGDYWAQSYSRSLNQWPSTAPEYQWMFNWDGHNPYWGGRITNYTVTYPGTGGIHAKGQIWASALMRIYDRIGKEKTDRAFLEGLALTTSTTNQQNAAIAVRQAGIDMLGQFGFNCTDITAMTEEFTAAGYILPEYGCTFMDTKEVNNVNTLSVYPNPATEVLHVSLKESKEKNAEIYNMEGRKVLEATIGKGRNEINISHLPSGTYIITVKGIDLSTKFIKK